MLQRLQHLRRLFQRDLIFRPFCGVRRGGKIPAPCSRGVLLVTCCWNGLHVAMCECAAASVAFFLEVSRFEEGFRDRFAIRANHFVAPVMGERGCFSFAHTFCSLSEHGFAFTAIDGGGARLMGWRLTAN